MDVPKPKPPVSKLVAIQPAAKPAPEKVKTPYVRKPHLTDRPFRDNAALQQMKSDMAQANTPKKPGRPNVQKVFKREIPKN